MSGHDERGQVGAGGSGQQTDTVPAGVVARFFWAARPLLVGCAVVLIGVAVAVALMFYIVTPDDEQLTQATLEAQPVIAALERYRHDKGDYPETLGELVPQYIAGVPDRVRYSREPTWVQAPRPTYMLGYQGAKTGGAMFKYWPGDARPYGGCLKIINGWCLFTT